MSHSEASPPRLSVLTVWVVDLARQQTADLDAKLLISKLGDVKWNK